MLTERFKNVTSLEIKFVINLLNNKTIILLNLAEYRLILADEAVRPSRLSIRRYSARFRRIIVKYGATLLVGAWQREKQQNKLVE